MNRTTRNAIYVALLWATPILASCDFPIDFWTDKSVTVAIMPGTMTMVTQTQTIDLTDPQYAAYFSKASIIKSISIPEVWVEVSMTPDQLAGTNGVLKNAATQVTGSLTVNPNPGTTCKDADGSPATPITISYSNVPIIDGGRVDLAPAQADIDKMQCFLLSDKKFSIAYSGDIDQTPASFNLSGEIHLVATVSVGG